VNSELKKYFDLNSRRVEKALRRFLPQPSIRPSIINEALRYSVFAGGKRLRPILVVAGAEVCGGNWKKVLPTACAVELIHTYSLIHDDLPAMDDDDFRRGVPTSHRVFGEDMAILAGDALLTHAFFLIARNAEIQGVNPRSVLKVIQILSENAGIKGMIGGQVADIKSDGGKWKKYCKTQYGSEKELLKFIHENKTAALIKGCLIAGAILSGGTAKKVRALAKFGNYLGLAFQVADDVLDRIGDKKKLGKKGSDFKNAKLTYPLLFGVEGSLKAARKFVEKAHEALGIFGTKAKLLHSLADFVIARDH